MATFITTTPVLEFCDELGTYILKLTTKESAGFNTQVEYAMAIYKQWNGESWYQYKFVRWIRDNAGNECREQVVTDQEYTRRRLDIEEHEGKEMADAWHRIQDYMTCLPAKHAVFGLRDHWEAILRLGLLDLPIYIHNHIPIGKLDEEQQGQLDDLRARLFAEGMEEAEYMQRLQDAITERVLVLLLTKGNTMMWGTLTEGSSPASVIATIGDQTFEVICEEIEEFHVLHPMYHRE